jgi:hypothetical protein
VIQRSDDGGRSWMPVGNEFRYEGTAGHAPVVRRHAASVGVRARVAPRAFAHRSRLRLRGRRGRGTVPVARWRCELAGAAGAARSRHGRRLATRRRRHVPAHDPRRPGRSGAPVHGDLVGGRVPLRRRGQDVEADQPRPRLRADPESHGRGGSLRASDRAARGAPERSVHAESTGT